MANVWMHNGFLQVEGQKMSKSLGNFYSINELLETETFGGRQWLGEVLRLAMLMTHYREPIDFSVNRLEEAENKLNTWWSILDQLTLSELKGSPSDELVTILNEDIGTPAAIAYLTGQENFGRSSHDGCVQFGVDVAFLGLAVGFAQERFDLSDHQYAQKLGYANKAALLQDTREKIRDLASAVNGVKASTVDGRIAERLSLIAQKNWAEADRIRDELLVQGIQLKDGKDPATGERITTWEVKR
jgi:cysteinyl-tRNA synthetase